MLLSAGTCLGHYEIVSAPGGGGMGEGYPATDTRLKRQVAVKLLPPSLAADPDRLARFQREAEVLATLNHPHIAAVTGREGDLGIFWQPADGNGAAEHLTRPDQGTAHFPESWTPKGDRFRFSASEGPRVSLWTFSLQERKAERFSGIQRSSAPLTQATFSPDGRWIA